MEIIINTNVDVGSVATNIDRAIEELATRKYTERPTDLEEILADLYLVRDRLRTFVRISPSES